MQKIFKKQNIVFILFILVLPIFSSAVELQNPIEADSFEELLNNIINFIFILATALVPLMVIIGGFMFVTAGGNPEMATKAKNLLLYTAIGYAVILLARGLIAFLQGIL